MSFYLTCFLQFSVKVLCGYRCRLLDSFIVLSDKTLVLGSLSAVQELVNRGFLSKKQIQTKIQQKNGLPLKKKPEVDTWFWVGIMLFPLGRLYNVQKKPNMFISNSSFSIQIQHVNLLNKNLVLGLWHGVLLCSKNLRIYLENLRWYFCTTRGQKCWIVWDIGVWNLFFWGGGTHTLSATYLPLCRSPNQRRGISEQILKKSYRAETCHL